MTTADRFAGAQSVANATVYEGYVLYPYRASATKNQMRFQWGVLMPPAYVAHDPSERTALRTEIIVDPGQEPVLHVRVRYLELQREDGWDTGIDRHVDLDGLRLLPLADASREVAFDGGLVRTSAAWADGFGALIKVTVDVENTSTVTDVTSRDDALSHALVAVHTLLAVDDGELISLLDPPDHAVDATKGCLNVGTYPVLVGDEQHPTVVLSSPIILYDHPVIAPESEGDLFDALEIDEILALRVLTLTDDEKAEARATDPRAAAIVDRIDDFGPEQWERMHGTMRSVREIEGTVDEEPLPWWEPAVDEGFDPYSDTLVIAGHEVSVGTKVRLQPNRRSDAHDMFLVGMDATVTGIFTDVDDAVMVAVTIDDDPMTEALRWQRRGLFFHPDELVVVS